MRGAGILCASVMLCGATFAQLARQPELAVHYPDQHRHKLETSVDETSSPPDFRGFQLWRESHNFDAKTLAKLSPACRTSMTQRIHCHKKTRSLGQRYARERWGLGLRNDTLSDLVCHSGCGESIATYFEGVERDCTALVERILIPAKRGGQLWAGWNETCLRDEKTERYCGDVIDGFKSSPSHETPVEELCSFCNVQRHQMKQTSPYSLYDRNDKLNLEHINYVCNLNLPTAMPNLVLSESPHIEQTSYFGPGGHCASNLLYTASAGDTCNSIATQFNVASAHVKGMNWQPIDCFDIPEGTRVCIPFRCKTYTLKDGDTCDSIERELDLKPCLLLSAVREYNRWVNEDCSNLHEASDALFGHVICVGPTGDLVLDA